MSCRTSSLVFCLFMSTCTHHPPFTVTSLVEVAGTVGVAMGLRERAAPTINPRTVCSVGKDVLHVSVYVCGGRYQCVHWYQDCTLTRSSCAVQIILVSGHSHLQCESCTSTTVGTACNQGYKCWVSVMKSTPVFRHWLGLETLIVKAIRAWKKIMWNSPIQRFCNCRPKIIQ